MRWHILQHREAPHPRGEPLPSHLVEESLAEVLHGALELIALGLPLLVVPHVLSCGPLPGGGPSVVIHIVKPASGICALFPAGNIKLRMNRATIHPYPQIPQKSQDGWQGGTEGGLSVVSGTGAWPGKPQSRRLLGKRSFVAASAATNPSSPLAPDFHLGDPCCSGEGDSTPKFRGEQLTGSGVAMGPMLSLMKANFMTFARMLGKIVSLPCQIWLRKHAVLGAIGCHLGPRYNMKLTQ